ncbi:exodeoxyribonuclease V subunit beta [Alteromonas sp. A079]|uniref:exodeoxyribonuclease V subunit beta n=1 Tax=Alteromonas sp. A079 TaxID=3410268 RepID=UPI003BA27D20
MSQDTTPKRTGISGSNDDGSTLSTTSNIVRATPLNVPDMPLHGRHLIEASAGTGKTFNITRLYLRFLLEKRLTVKEILVMTFTKAATEEIKGRIAKTLREASAIWQQTKNNDGQAPRNIDPVYAHLLAHCDVDDSLARLKAAQLELDEASVFTIHGFCQHVIGQLAFNSGFAMSLNLSKDTSELYLQAAEDWIRKVSQNDEDFLLLAQSGWHVPARLLTTFLGSIKSPLTPLLLDKDTIEASFTEAMNNSPDTANSQFEYFLSRIEENTDLIDKELMKTAAHKQTRPAELDALKEWLGAAQYTSAPPAATAFLDGRRYARNKSGVKELLSPIKNFVKAVETAVVEKQDALGQIPVFTLVNQAISFIKKGVAKQKKQLGVIDFDDLIHMLADEVVKPNNTLVPELRKKFPVALIDEFQDTDAKQYAILDAVYPKLSDATCDNTDVHRQISSDGKEGDAQKTSNALLMIGDPKQAIYRFRGGDIFTYLKAGQHADYRWVMNTNWRSVEGMVAAYNRLFYGAPLASGRSTDVFGFNIQYNPVEFSSHAAAAKAPLHDPHHHRNAMNFISMGLEEKQDINTMRRGIAQWIAQEIYRLLNEATFVARDGTDNESFAVKPADIAILVKDRTEANVIKYVLQQKGLACVYLSDRSNLFITPEAKDVLRLLNGIWHASDSSKLASSLASPLWGYSPHVLIDLLYHEDDALWDSAYENVLSLREMWLQKGCMSVLLHLMQTSYQPYGNDVERALTNYQHLAEVLEKASTTHQRPEQLLDWLHKQIHQPDTDEEMTLRLESDSQLIRLITQHGSKGLEYPIVFVPYATGYKDPAKNGKSMAQIFSYYDDNKQALQLQLGQTKHAIERVRAEGQAEDMRLAYVAVTRAAHRCYMGIIPLDGNEKSPLARALGVGRKPAEDTGETQPQDWLSVLSAINNEQDAFTCHISANDIEEVYTTVAQDTHVTELSALAFTGTDKEDWRLFSFSAISRLTAHGNIVIPTQNIQTIPVLQTVRDEEIVTAKALADIGLFEESESKVGESPVEAADKLRFTLTKGASAGNLLHDLLELNDFSAPTWEENGSELVKRFGLDKANVPYLYDWLDEVLHTPLYPHTDKALSDLTLSQTLREAEFYFPMNNSKWASLSRVLAEHRARVASRLGAPALTVPSLMTPHLAGMMHGFIDLIFEHNGKYYVADYKSTWLGDDIASYQPAALFENNQQHMYDLQYLIYCLALHRYLKNAIPDYCPNVHFGGVYYLYLRGMHPQNQQGEGVFFTSISSNTLSQLDNVFENGENSVVTNADQGDSQQQFSFDDTQGTHE